MLALVVIMAIFLAWGLCAGRLARWSVTAPLAMTLAGIALTAGSHPVFVINIETSSAEHGAEVVLAMLLFIDATEVPGAILGPEPRLTLRLLALGLPLSFAVTWAAGVLAFPGHGLWLLAVIAIVVLPIDMSPAAAVIRDKRIPRRLRDLLNVESGLNDGIAAPVFLVCLAAVDPHGSSTPAEALVAAVPSVLVAIAVGAAIGYGSGRIVEVAWRRGWTQPSPLRLGLAALPLIAYGAAIELGGNGFVAAFVAGVAFAPAAHRLPADVLDMAEDVGGLLSLVVWFVFGRLINEVLADGVRLRVVVFVLVALTVARIVPVLLALIGTSLNWTDRLVLGWLGPRGLATIVFGLLAFIDLSGSAADLVAEVMVITVLASIVLQGITAGPIAAWYGRQPASTRDPVA